MAGKNFDAFKDTIEREFMGHPVVKKNEYTAWFSHGDVPLDHLRQFTVQFSVFSNQFLLAALNRVINADTLQAARESKEILMNELGVIYNKVDKKGSHSAGTDRQTAAGNSTTDREGDPALVATEGTVDGGKFRFQAAHIEWLLRFGEPLGLTFDDIGKRRHGIPSTLHFCDELFRLYGSDDYNEAMGASFAVENWAAAGFWKELIAGLERIKARSVPDLPLAFFTWHDKIEDQHREHTWDELRECYDSAKFREEPFIRAGVKMLDGVKVFWDGLNDLRRHPHARVA
jgi:pyrroloquinoline quinone (PQQ) biosynthesis protein C